MENGDGDWRRGVCEQEEMMGSWVGTTLLWHEILHQ